MKKKKNKRINYMFVVIILLVMLLLSVVGSYIFKGTKATDVSRYRINFNVNSSSGTIEGNDFLYVINGSSVLLANNEDNTKGTIPIVNNNNLLFTGWWTDSEGGELVIYPSLDVVENTIDGYVFNKKWQITDDITLYAQYTENGYKVTYNCTNNGGYTNDVYMVYNYNEEVSLDRVCYKTDLYTPNSLFSNWTFMGWNTDKNATNGIGNYIVENSDTTLYAIYKKDKVVLKANWNNNGDSIASSMPTTCTIPAVYNNQVQEDSCIVHPPVMTPDSGYMFIGWNTDRNAKVSSDAYNKNTNELTLSKDSVIETSQFSPDDETNAGIWYAIFDIVKYKIIFNVGDGSLKGNTEFYIKNGENVLYLNDNDDFLGSMPLASKIGYTFDGWYTSDDIKVIDRFGYIVNYDVDNYVLNGKWNVNAGITLYAHYNIADGFNNDNISLSFNDVDNFIVDDENKILYQIGAGMNSSQLFSMIQQNDNLSILDNNGNLLLEDVIIKTGYTLRAIINEDVVYYKLSVKGDVLGTGELSRDNAKEIAKYIIDRNNITGDEYLLAADYDNNGNIKMSDVIKMMIDMRRN